MLAVCVLAGFWRASLSIRVSVVCGVFGRDEGGSEFTFSQNHVDMLLEKWTSIVRAVGHNAVSKPTTDTIMVVDLAISDVHKPLLLNNPHFIPYLVDALLLDPAHPRAEMKTELKAWCQQHHTEALAQLAATLEGAEALQRDPLVRDALRAVAEEGLSEVARQHAESALLGLSGKELQVVTEGQKHVMLSCECLPQASPT